MPTGNKFKLMLGIFSVVMILGLLGACSEQIASPVFAAMAVKDPAVAATGNQAELEIEVEGIVQALSNNSITINGRTFTYDPAVVAQNGFPLVVGAEAKVKARLVNGVVQVVQIVAGKVEDNTPTPSVSPTVTITTTVMPTATAGDDNDHNRGNDDGQGDDRGRGNDDGQDDNGVTPTPRPTATGPAATVTAKATPTRGDDHGNDRGQGDGKGDNRGKATATPRPTSSPKLTPTPAPKDDRGKGDDKGKGDDSSKGGGKGKGK